MTDETVIKYIRQDVIALSDTMKKSFDKLEKKIDSLRTENESDYKDIVQNCSKKRGEIYSKIETNRKNIEQLDKKFFRLFLIGTGFGFVAGVLATVAITRLMGG